MTVLKSVDGKTCGTLENRTLLKRVHGRIHRVRVPPGWAIDKVAFDRVADQCDTIVVEDLDSQQRFEVGVDTFLRRRFTMDRGYGAQYILPLKFWQVVGLHQVRLL